MTAEQREVWVRRIAAMKALADHPNTSQEEAATFAAKAAELMLKFEIEDFEIERATGRKRANYTKRSLGRMGAIFWRDLGFALAHANFCEGIMVKVRTGHPYFEVVGTEDHLDVVEYLFRYMSREIDRLAREDWKRRLLAHTTTGKESQHWRAFWYGAVTAIRIKLDEQRDSVSPDARAMIVLRDADLDAELDRLYPGRGHDRSKHRKLDGSAFSAGFDAGKKMAAPTALPSPKQ